MLSFVIQNSGNERKPGLYLVGDLADVFDLGFRMPRSLQAEKRQVEKRQNELIRFYIRHTNLCTVEINKLSGESQGWLRFVNKCP